MWRSLFRWVLRRRPRLEAGAEAFGYTAAAAPVLWAFIVLSAIEIPAVDLLMPWPTVRVIGLALGAYGLMWMVGMLASLRVHPHVVGERGVRVRRGFNVDVTVPWDDVATISARTRSLPSSRRIQFDRTESGIVAHVVMLSQTNVEIVFRGPMTLPLPKGGDEPIAALRFWADDPRALVARAREHLPPARDVV